MNFDVPTPAAEEEPRFPTLEEINAKMKELCGREDTIIIRTLEDTEGVYLHDITFVDENGDAVLYSYRRSGDYQQTKSATTQIDVAYFMGALQDNICIGGDVVTLYNEETHQWTHSK